MAADAARDARWLQDLDTLTAQLPALHPNLFFQTPRSEFDRAAADLRAAIPDLNDAEVMVGLARITALPGDGHTNLSLSQRNSVFHFLPLQLRWFEDGLFVTLSSPDYARAVGSRVIQIGDRSAEEAHRMVAAIISHENDSWVREIGPTYLVNTDILRALKIAPSADSVTLVLQDLSGTRFTLDIASLPGGSTIKAVAVPDAATGFIPYYRQQTNQNYWFTYIESSRTLYFAYNVCAEQAGLPFAQFNNQLWAVFDTRPVERFIIDLRNNTGGNSGVLDPFLASRRARASRFSGVKPVVIIGRRTYSSAIINAIAIRQTTATLVGEPSGGSPNSYGEVKTLTLPNSQLVVNYSSRYFSFPGYPAGSLMPDVAATDLLERLVRPPRSISRGSAGRCRAGQRRSAGSGSSHGGERGGISRQRAGGARIAGRRVRRFLRRDRKRRSGDSAAQTDERRAGPGQRRCRAADRRPLRSDQFPGAGRNGRGKRLRPRAAQRQ